MRQLSEMDFHIAKTVMLDYTAKIRFYEFSPPKFCPFSDPAGNDLQQLPGGVQGEPFLANCPGLFPKLELPSWDMAAGNDFFL